MFFEGSGLMQLYGAVPRPALFFCQIAALFPHAATYSIEYRAQGHTCNSRVVQLDLRPYFPIPADDKGTRLGPPLPF